MTVKQERTLLVTDQTGAFRITVPATAKITFAPIQPKHQGYTAGYVLRIYESANRQLAAFDGVIGFRDLALPVERLTIAESGEEAWETDEGGSTRTIKRKRDRQWVPQ